MPVAEVAAAGRGTIGKSVTKGQLLASIADETTARQLKQAQADLKAATERAKLPLPSEELLKAAEDNLHRLEQVVASGNVPAVEYEKAKSEANRLRGALENERIERDRNLQSLDEARKKLESQMRNSEIRAPMDGLLSAVSTIDGELVAESNQLFTISSRKTYVRGEVNEEDVGEVKPGMKAKVQLYAYRTQTFEARVSSVQPAADPDTQRYTVILEMEKPPDNLMAGMTGEMNIITGTHENALLVPTRALLVDQALVVKRGVVQRRTIKVGFRTLDFVEALSGVSAGDRVVFGVAIFICTQAQTQGFAQYFINSTIGSSGAMVLRTKFQPGYEGLAVAAKNTTGATNRRTYFEGVSNVSEIMRVSRQFSNVVACAPVLRGNVSARAGFENASVEIYGIDPAAQLKATDLATQIIAGKFDDFSNNTSAVIIGYKLADFLNVGAGDAIQILSPGGEYWRFTVAAIARSGVGTVDLNRVYAHARVAQRLLKKPYQASMIIYKLRNPSRAPELANHFEELFQHRTESWQEREEGNLQIFFTLQVSAAITVSLIILLAGFGIFNVLTMSVLSKVREIAILRSMGYRRIDISSIFLWQGALIAGVGSLLGCVLGAVLTWGISKVPIHIRGLLYTNHFLVVWDWRHYFWATLLAVIAVFIASYVPSQRAAHLQPVDTLRGSSL